MNAITEMKPRRQVWVGVVVAVLGVFTIANAIYQDQRVDNAIECFETNFSQLTTAATTRSDAAAEVNAAEDDIFEQLLEILEARPESKRQTEALEALKVALQEREEASADVQANREKNPYPDYPEGKCTP